MGESDLEEIERNGRKRSGSGRCRVFGGSRDGDGFAKKKYLTPPRLLTGLFRVWEGGVGTRSTRPKPASFPSLGPMSFLYLNLFLGPPVSAFNVATSRPYNKIFYYLSEIINLFLVY